MVTIGCLNALALLVLVVLGLTCKFIESLVQVSIGCLIDRTRQFEGRRINRRKLRHDLKSHLKSQIFLARNDLVHVGDKLHFCRSSWPNLGLFKSLLAGLVQLSVDDFAHQITAEGFLDIASGYLTRPEALQAELWAHFLELEVQLGVQLADGNGHGDNAAETFDGFFDDLHGRDSDALEARRPRRARRGMKKARRPPQPERLSKPALM